MGSSYRDAQMRKIEGLPGSGKSLEQKFWPAMGLYAILAAVIWFTLGEGTIFAFGRPVEIRLIPLFVIGTFVLRAIVAREADKIRQRSEDEAGKL